MPFLYDFQKDAVTKMHTGCILNGGVGSGKSRTSLYYYFTQMGGVIDDDVYRPMRKPLDLYIITTAMKRDKREWDDEMVPFLLSSRIPMTMYPTLKVTVDSWNNIKNYVDVSGAFFIFDEDRVTGYGAWVKAFLKIVKKNQWIILSATPGDTWNDYIPVFIANGYYKNKTEFDREHTCYDRYCRSYPRIIGYRNEGHLLRLRESLLVDMDFKRHTIPHHLDIWCDYDITKYKEVMKTRWNPFTDEPIAQASELCYVLRKIVNSNPDRLCKLGQIVKKHDRTIVFYNFTYELDAIKDYVSRMNLDISIAEWNGIKHQPIPDTDRWIYLVQYNSGAEGWNCITTNALIFYSANYSYKMTAQAAGRIDRANTPYTDLYYYHLKSKSVIDRLIDKALKSKKTFNERTLTKYYETRSDRFAL